MWNAISNCDECIRLIYKTMNALFWVNSGRNMQIKKAFAGYGKNNFFRNIINLEFLTIMSVYFSKELCFNIS